MTTKPCVEVDAKMEYYMSELKRKKANHEASKKDEDSLGDMKVVQEMYARGFEFLPIRYLYCKGS